MALRGRDGFSISVDRYSIRWVVFEKPADSLPEKGGYFLLSYIYISMLCKVWFGYGTVGWGGMGLITFLGTCTPTCCYVRDGVGWGGANNVPWHLRTNMMLGWRWGGVWWGVMGLITFLGTCTPTWCYVRDGVGWGEASNVLWHATVKLLYFVWSPPWHLYILLLANLLAFYLANILALYLAYLLAFYLTYLMAFYLAYLLAFYLTFYLAYLLAFYLAVEVQRCTLSWAGPRLRSSSAHWAGKVPGWGPAVHTELGRSQVEVQRCPLSWEGPRLRSSGAHWAGKVL